MNFRILIELKERGYRVNVDDKLYMVRKGRGEATILECGKTLLVSPRSGARNDIITMRKVKEDLREITGSRIMDYYEYFGVRGGWSSP